MVVNDAHSRLIAVSEGGQIYWQTFLEPAQYALAAPTVADGILYAAGDDGYLYAFNLNTLVPSANFNAAPHNLEATFTATDEAGWQFEYDWAFDDGSFGNGKSVVHTFAAAGSYNVTLTVSGPGMEDAIVTNVVTVHALTAPRDFVATPGENNVTLSWLAPADDGGLDIVS